MLQASERHPRPPLRLPASGPLWVSLGCVRYRLERTESPRRVSRFCMPEPRLVWSAAGAAILTAAILAAAAMSVPELNASSEVSVGRGLQVSLPPSRWIRLHGWAATIGDPPALVFRHTAPGEVPA